MSPVDGRYTLDVLIPGDVTVIVRNGKIEEIEGQRLETSMMSLDSGQSEFEKQLFSELLESDAEWPGWEWI